MNEVSFSAQSVAHSPNMPTCVKGDTHLDSVRFDRAGVLKVINKLKSNSVSGPGGFHLLLLECLGACLDELLSVMFDSSPLYAKSVVKSYNHTSA